jgi:hypothetical protein
MTNDDSFARYQQQEARRQAMAAKLREPAKEQLFNILHARGVRRVLVVFDGQGDSGQIEEITAFDADGAPVELPTEPLTVQTAKTNGDGSEPITLPVPELIEHLCYEILGEKYLGWQDGEGAFGEFALNAADRTLTLTFNQRFSDFDTSTQTF